MALAHSPRIVTNGLVFAYDMNNTQKSWRGAPTTNLLQSTNFTTGWAGYCGSTSNITYNTLDTTAPDGSYTALKHVRGSETSCGQGASWGLLHFLASLMIVGQPYTISVWAKTNGPSFGVTLGHNDAAGGAVISLNSQWQRFSFTYTPGDTSRGFQFINSNVNTTTYWWNPQCENNTFATPFVNGTRSNTQAVLDLTNNNTVTATSLTYAANNTFSFNGSNSLTIPYNPSLFTFNSEQTIIIWMKNEASVAARRNPYNQAFGGGGTITHENNTNFNYIYGTSGVNNVPYDAHGSPFSVVLNETAQIAITRNASQTAWYKNGALGNTRANPYGATVVTGTSPILLGTGYTNGVIGGLYAVQIYNRALSATEVSQNFNALRGRYGI